MQNSGTGQNAGRPSSKGQMPPGEQMGTNDTQSEFSVNESRRAAAQEENEQRQQQSASAADEKDSKQQKANAQAHDTQSEFSVEQRLREDQKK